MSGGDGGVAFRRRAKDIGPEAGQFRRGLAPQEGHRIGQVAVQDGMMADHAGQPRHPQKGRPPPRQGKAVALAFQQAKGCPGLQQRLHPVRRQTRRRGQGGGGLRT